MKKTIIFLMVVLTAFSAFAYSSTIPGTPFNSINKAYVPTDTAESNYVTYALFKDPTVLSGGKFSLALPSVSVTQYNTSSFLSSDAGSELASDIVKFKFSEIDKNRLISALYTIVDSLGVGYNDLVDVDVNAGAAGNNWVIGVNARVSTDLWSESGAGTDAEIKPMLDLTGGFGFNVGLVENDSFNLNFAVVTKFAFRAYTLNDITASSIESFDIDDEIICSGWAVPVDVALGTELYNKTLRFTLSATNLNGYYYMAKHENYKDAINIKGGYEGYTEYTPWSLNAAVIFDPDIPIIDPKIRVELVDIYNYVLNKDGNEEIMSHMNIGAEVKILNFLSVKGALNAGYWQVGAGLDIAGNNISLLYGWHEAGDMLGYKPVDSLTLRVTLGYDGN